MLLLTYTQSGVYISHAQLATILGESKLSNLINRWTIVRSHRMGNKINKKEEKLYKYVSMNNKLYLLVAPYAVNDIKVEYKIINKIPTGIPIDPIKLLPGPTLDSNQQLISDYFNSTVYSKENDLKARGGAILVMNTGLGKTYFGVSKIKDFACKTLIIVPTTNIVSEWRKVINICYPELTVGEYHSKKKCDGDVVIMVINSATLNSFKFKDKTIKSDIYFAQFGFVIYDEIHNYVSTSRQRALWNTNFRKRLGLTATPDENSWGFDIINEKHVGPFIRACDIDNFDPNQTKWIGDIIPVFYYGSPEYTLKIINPANGWTSHPHMVNQFCQDPVRNILIRNTVLKLHKAGRNIFVFFKTREYANILADLLNDAGIRHDKELKAAILMGGSSETDEKNAHTAHVVLTTYGFGWQGVSIPKMDTLVFATPRVAKMNQIIGRILRKSGDPNIPRLIVDIIDANTEMGMNEFRDRKKK